VSQIWFQNRRQSSRRKSRPLLPHEIAQYQLARQGSVDPQNLSSDAVSGTLPDVSSHQHVVSSTGKFNDFPTNVSHGPKGSAPPTPSLTNVTFLPEATSLPVSDDAPIEESLVPPTSFTGLLDLAPGHLVEGQLASHKPQSGAHSHLGILTERSHHGQAQSSKEVSAQRSLRKSSSQVRLSMSFDGNACVVTQNLCSPSPPRPVQGPPLHNANASSSTSLAEGGQRSQQHRRSLQRTASGRSRDSRAWEFWCDKDARNELETKAEQDASGSAADAIGLLRSASGRSILGGLSAKHNSVRPTQHAQFKRLKVDSRRAPLQRASTSMARLQRSSGPDVARKQPVLKHSGSAISVYIPGNESDKENWHPVLGSFGEKGEMPIEHVVVDDKGRPLKTRDFSRTHANHTGIGKPLSGSTDVEEDAEIAAFMRNGRQSNSMSSEEDMDCVQGLLSLSQGNWK
jgi:hypothetical protein